MEQNYPFAQFSGIVYIMSKVFQPTVAVLDILQPCL